MTAALEVRKVDSSFPWEVVVARGPSKGMRVGYGYKLKREAVAQADRLGHLPWEYVRSIHAALQCEEMIVTVPLVPLEALHARLRSTERELKAARRVLLDVAGSAMALDQAMCEVLREEAERGAA